MAFEDFKSKDSVIIVFTGDGKGKTSASLGLLARTLGNRGRAAFIQFVKYWGVSEHVFLRDISGLFKDQLYFYKGGKGFYNAGELSAKNFNKQDHIAAASETYAEALKATKSGEFQLVICDEINNAVHDGLLDKKKLSELIKSKHPDTSLCLTGRNFPADLLPLVDIATDMAKIKHHFDDNYIANEGIDY